MILELSWAKKRKEVNNVFARDKNNMKKSAIYLGKIGIGWIIGILSSILLLSALFEKNIYFMS